VRRGHERVTYTCTCLKTKGILKAVAPKEQNGQAVRKQLERVLSSAGFARSERLSQFLRFVVERQLEGKDDELKEPLIAIEVFGRKPDYDPKQDSIVRTEAGRLRSRLVEYYAGEGHGDPVVIELPKGGYTPVFRQPGAAPEANRSLRPQVGTRLWIMVALAGLAIGVAATGWWWVQHKSVPVVIAVLPLENLGHDPANDYFADGLTDELIRNLSVIEGLVVRSRTSSFALKGKPRNVREAGQQLQADYILEGSVVRAGQQLRINTQLIRVRDDVTLWSARFDRELPDALAIQDEISRGIVNSLRLKLGRGRRRYETSVEAYDHYLRARAAQIHPGGFAGGNQSIGPFEEAIAKDPSFAPAYAGLAVVYTYRSGIFGFDRADELAKMRAAAEKAIQLDPLLAEAHDAMGMVHARDGQWEQSEKSFRRAIEIDPNNGLAYAHFAFNHLLALGRIEEAIHQMRVAEKIDPLASEVQSVLAYVLISAGRYDEAAGHCQKLPSTNSDCLGRARLGQGRTGEAIELLATIARGNRGYLGFAYARAGRREEAEQVAEDVSPNPFNQALVYAGLGDKDRTLEALDRLAAFGAVRVGRALNIPEMALLRGDPRVKALRKKAGLPE